MAEQTQILDFEKPVVELERELWRLRNIFEGGDIAVKSDVEKAEKKLERLKKDVYSGLSAYERVLLSRHADRPFTLDYVKKLFPDYQELKGDRVFGEDAAIIGGVGIFSGRSVVFVGHQRGRTTQERIFRNFGMSRPEGNRKAQRLYALAEKFRLPLILFIDTNGAYPGVEAEERGQAEAIAKCLMVLSGLKTPIISIVIGEGGSGGALALGICDRLLMLENSTYSVISSEGCASIVWSREINADKTKAVDFYKQSADALKLTAAGAMETGIVDELIKEPLGGAHKDPDGIIETVGHALARNLSELAAVPVKDLLDNRYKKFRKIGSLK